MEDKIKITISLDKDVKSMLDSHIEELKQNGIITTRGDLLEIAYLFWLTKVKELNKEEILDA